MPSLNVLKAARKMRQEASPRAHVRAEDFGVPALRDTPSIPEPNPQLPPTVHYVPSFISSADEELLLRHIAAAPASRWTPGSGGRRTQNWGGRPGEAGVREALPDWLQPLVDALGRSGAWPADRLPNHVLINEFEPGAGLTPHTDGPLYIPRVATLSLGSDCVLDLHDSATTPPRAHLLLRRRSLNVMAGTSYTHLFHGITAREADAFRIGAAGELVDASSNAPIANAASATQRGTPSGPVQRQRRWSVVFVHKVLAGEDRGDAPSTPTVPSPTAVHALLKVSASGSVRVGLLPAHPVWHVVE